MDRQPGILDKVFSEKNLTRLAIAIVLFGIILRVVVYFQHRCLIIDEANVARNLYERGFMGLTTPLSYEQYAPPLYLWIVKCCTLLFGFGELSLRLPALLCGIASMWLLYKALKQYATVNAAWYALMIFATGMIYVRYSSELKQYMCDVVVVLALLLLALRTHIFTTSTSRFVLIWGVAGSLAIWLSMPSVFMLAGIGVYYFYISMKAKDYSKIAPIAIISLIWLAQFAAYYFIILKPQIKSDYLQNYHKDSFLFKFPNTPYKRSYNLNVLHIVFANMGGEKWPWAITFHSLAFFTGCFWLLWKHTAKAILIIVPIGALYVAAGFRQFALAPRIVLFIMPIILIVIAAGLHALFSIRYKAIHGVWVVIGIVCILNFGEFGLLTNRMELEELTQSMEFIQQQKVTGAHLYVNNACVPAYLYYTTIHPAKDRWKDLSDAHLLHWDSRYDSLGQTFTGRSALLYGWWPEDNIQRETGAIKSSRKEVLKFIRPQTRAYFFE